MRIIIAGSRNFNNYDLLEKELNKIFHKCHQDGSIPSKEDMEIVSGTANGADKLGERFANEYGINLAKFPADWNRGKSAGYIRNEQMALYAKANKAGMLVAFWDGESKGTKHMIDLANKHGLRVFVINYKKESKVVNCKKEGCDVYIGRPSKWGNPFEIGKDGTREEVIRKYKDWILEQPELMRSLGELKNKTLGCWCSPQACHGDVLIALVSLMKEE